MAKATKKEMKKEALRYMEMLEIHEDIRHSFEENGTLYVSYGEEGLVRPADEFEINLAKSVEKEYGGMIYHIVYNKAFDEYMLTLLHVSEGKHEWEHYLTRMGDGSFLTCAYVESPFEKAFGSVVMASSTSGPGIVRKG